MKKVLFTILALLSVYVVNAQCNTSFVVTGNSGLNVEVTNNSQVSIVPGSTPVTYYTWGDGSPHTQSGWQPGTVTSHTYTTAGTYHIVLWTQYFDTLNNVLICDDSVSHMVTVNNNLPCNSTASVVDNGGGSYTFTANLIGGGTGMTHTWNFGDGTPAATGSSVTHTYSNSGIYTVSLVTTDGAVSCTTTTVVYYFNGVVDCSQLDAAFSYNVSMGSIVNFSNNSTPANIPVAPIYMSSFWNFGDNSTSTQHSPVHAYTAPGTYTVSLVVQWIDSNTNIVHCTDTAIQMITVTAPQNLITGNITWDSVNNLTQTSFKVWLITFDSATNIIDAVDSVIVSGALYQVSYTFNNVPAGEYRVKAAVLNGASGATSLIPSYHFSSSYWGSANIVNHTGGSSLNKHIHLQAGTPSSGPGFISGNVTQGAGKGTGAGVPGLLVLLRDASNQMIRFTYTDANGDYSFGNLAAGTYNVYPENMPQVTTPSASITLASGSYTVDGIDFEKISTAIRPLDKTTGIENTPANNIFSIYPNPTDGVVNLNWNSNVSGKVSIKVMDMTGREIFNANANTNADARVDLNDVPAGVYFINVTSDKAQHTQKLTIK